MIGAVTDGAVAMIVTLLLRTDGPSSTPSFGTTTACQTSCSCVSLLTMRSVRLLYKALICSAESTRLNTITSSIVPFQAFATFGGAPTVIGYGFLRFIEKDVLPELGSCSAP